MYSEKYYKSTQIFIPAKHTYLIKADAETDCEDIKVSLLNGTAYIHGFELKRHFPHTHKMPCIVPVFTWDSCEIRVYWKEDKTGKCMKYWRDLSYNSLTPSPMCRYLELHYNLTCLRKLSLEYGKIGPRVAIVGGYTSASHIITRTLLNYIGKINMRPMFVDLDLDNSIYIDGTIGAMVFEYKLVENVTYKNDKLVYCYGNRRIRLNSFLKQSKNLSYLVNKRLYKYLKNYKYKGSYDYFPTFSSGVIVHCPRFSYRDDRKLQRYVLDYIVKMFSISHILVIYSSDLQDHFWKYFPKLEKILVPKLYTTEYFLTTRKKNKLTKYLGSEIEQITVNITLVKLYYFIYLDLGQPYCRLIDVRGELINKTAICILHATNDNDMNKYQIAEKVSTSPIRCIAKIFKITEEYVTLEVAMEGFWYECKDRIWVSMISYVQHS